MGCRNPLLAEQRILKREELLQATEKVLEPIVTATRRKKYRLKGKDRIGERVPMDRQLPDGEILRVVRRWRWIFPLCPEAESIAAEALLDGLYIIRTSLPETEMGAAETVQNHK